MTREEAIGHIKDVICENNSIKPNMVIFEQEKEALYMAIKALEQEPKIGHWIKTGDYYTGAYGSIDYVECSCCHEYSLEEGNYCPNCGADMREVEE